MSKLEVTRRGVLQSAAAMATIAALGLKPEQVLAADEGVLKVRMVEDIQVLDPGYMIGGAETTIQYALPRLAVPVKTPRATGPGSPPNMSRRSNRTIPTSRSS